MRFNSNCLINYSFYIFNFMLCVSAPKCSSQTTVSYFLSILKIIGPYFCYLEMFKSALCQILALDFDFPNLSFSLLPHCIRNMYTHVSASLVERQ